MICKLEDRSTASPIFAAVNKTFVQSCLQGIMGEIYGDSPSAPKSAMAVLGDFTFFGGEPKPELVCFRPPSSKADFRILIPENEEWGEMIRSCYKGRAKEFVRYAMKQETFNREALQRAANSLGPGYTLKAIDEELYHTCKKADWSADFVSQYADYEMYARYGIGVLVLKNGESVAGASSYACFPGGIEIEIDTKTEYRRQGLAFACGAKLILNCLDRGIYPNWDAHNRESMALAKKLGYRLEQTYAAFTVTG